MRFRISIYDTTETEHGFRQHLVGRLYCSSEEKAMSLADRLPFDSKIEVCFVAADWMNIQDVEYIQNQMSQWLSRKRVTLKSILPAD